jgi:hypothetical protein
MQTPEREFTIKMSAMEIYNENVKDLLMPDSGPLRLLDDPEVQQLFQNSSKEDYVGTSTFSFFIFFCLPLLFVFSRKEQLLRNWRSKLPRTAST